MRYGLPRCLLAFGVVLVATLAVAAGTPPSRPDPAPQGYGRVLAMQQGAAPTENNSLRDCLMQRARLRSQTGDATAIPEDRFEALRACYRRAALDRSSENAVARPDAGRGAAARSGASL